MTTALFDHLRFQARLRPGALAVHGPVGPVTYQRLVHDVDVVATELLEHGLTRQDMVGLQLGITYLHVLLVLALDRLSIPSLSFAGGSVERIPPALLERYAATAIIAATPAPAAPPCRWIHMADEHRSPRGTPDLARLAALDMPADALLRVTWSSGTTGGSKGIPITRPIQHVRMEVRRQLRGIGPHTRYFPGMPFSSASGDLVPVTVLSAGGAVILPSPASDFVSLANALGVTMTSGPPGLLAELLGKERNLMRRLETVEYFDVVGAELPSQLARDARFFLTPNLWTAYGASEVGRVAAGDAALCIADPGAAGFLVPWAEVEIVDAAGQPLAIGREGVMRVRTPQMVAGYVRDDEATRRNFRDGWFYPGDVAAITEHGMLRVVGRVEDMIVQHGDPISPRPLEEAIRGVPGVRDVAVFGLARPDGTEEVCAAVVLDDNVDQNGIYSLARTRLGDRAPSRFFKLDALPRNANGKVQRHELAARARGAGA